MDALPIDPLVPDIAGALAREGVVVVEAPPGAGKTTRVPRGLFDSGILGEREALVLEPRRLAARLPAKRVAEELGEPLGRTVGYQVRFEDVSSSATRLRFVTEGILTRRLLSDPTLANVACVLLDEFHERHLQADLGLALLTRLRRTTRPDLKLAVMSATLDVERVTNFLGARSIRSEGRRFDVELEHAERDDSRRLEEQVSGAVKRLVQRGLDGDVLVFLPGAAEIRRALDACAGIAESANLEVLPLHGDLPPAEQDRAIRPSSRRKVILSTNVAETSVTIDGVVAVVDSGLARIASHSPWSGLGTLKVQKVSKASATQRAGRAGRTRPGRALRLFTLADFHARRDHDEPEIRRLDLAQTVLELASAGIEVDALPWFEPPPKANVEAARELLRRLGAIDHAGITRDGKRMASLPLHPRLAKLVLEADARSAGREGCQLAAVLGERLATRASDPVEALEEFLRSRDRMVERAASQIERAFKPGPTRGSWSDVDRALRIALLAAYPDRVARRRSRESRDVVFASGGSGQLPEGTAHGELLVAVDAEDRREGTRGGVLVRSASGIEEDWLLELPEGVEESVTVEWNPTRERAEAMSRMKFGALVLDERSFNSADPAELSRVLFEAAKSAGVRAFADAERLDRLLERVRFVARTFPEAGIEEPSPDALERALARVCEGRTSFAGLRDSNFEAELASALGADARMDRLAPESLTLPGGRRVSVHYDAGQPPWIESRLQDFFGARDIQKLGGRVPLVIHLLAPNGRAQQVTTDLAGFWERHYPAVRKELMRRYPRHAWPEDPLTATPPAPRR